MKTLEAPTPSELETLAKVAGRFDTKKLEEIQEYKKKGGAGFWIALMAEKALYDQAMYKWRPHKDLNQISLILKGMTYEQVEKYTDIMTELWDKTETKYNVYVWMQTVDPSISAKAILETLEQEKG